MARHPELRKHTTAHGSAQGQPAHAAGTLNALQPAAAATVGLNAQAPWPGSGLLQFVPEQQFKLLQQSQQLVGLHQHMGHSYAVSIAAVEAAAQQGKAALLVGSIHLAGQLKLELPDAQVR
jgi:hypothetical protein